MCCFGSQHSEIVLCRLFKILSWLIFVGGREHNSRRPDHRCKKLGPQGILEAVGNLHLGAHEQSLFASTPGFGVGVSCSDVGLSVLLLGREAKPAKSRFTKCKSEPRQASSVTSLGMLHPSRSARTF